MFYHFMINMTQGWEVVGYGEERDEDEKIKAYIRRKVSFMQCSGSSQSLQADYNHNYSI